MTDVKKSTCHCGKVELRLVLPDGFGQVRRCDCSICAKKGAAVTSVLLDNLEVVKGADNLTLYQFNSNTARHYFCSTCGIYTHHRRRSNPNEYSVNIACIEGLDIRKVENIEWLDGRNHSADRI